MKKKKGLLTKELKNKLRNSRDDREILENLAVASKELDTDDLLFVTGGAQYEASVEQVSALTDELHSISGQPMAAIESLMNDAKFGLNAGQVFDQNTDAIELVNPDGLTLNMGSGNNSGLVPEGEVSVSTGDSNDNMITFETFRGKELPTGSGDNAFVLDGDAQENAEISVDAGDGFDVMRLFGQTFKHSFQFSDGKFHMH